ncbi:deoxyribonuclease [Mobiluncus sp.]|uniref:endonuclease III domain-containing protein n=1 Tax=Mobiluncus sp. TaxID=47293 RepID=UPI002A90E4CE|nr:deoxyribonuclease [Mobiluncus sp.]MDY6077700.1 deoxyribonuclease [Mobiluncus sp.]
MGKVTSEVPTFREIYETLERSVQDAGKWWPAETKFEILVGAVLTQNTTWTSVEKSLENLRVHDLLDPGNLLKSPQETLESLIKPSGFMRAKAGYLKNLTEWYKENDATADAIDTQTLRASLLNVKGIGQETADDILLYAYLRPVFIYDTYGRRLLEAAGLGSFKTYDAARNALDERVYEQGFTTEELARFHGLIVQAGKDARRAGGWEGILKA